MERGGSGAARSAPLVRPRACLVEHQFEGNLSKQYHHLSIPPEGKIRSNVDSSTYKVQEAKAAVKENAPVSTRLPSWSLRVLGNCGKASARTTPPRLKTGRLWLGSHERASANHGPRLSERQAGCMGGEEKCLYVMVWAWLPWYWSRTNLP